MNQATRPFLISTGISGAVGVQASRLCQFGFTLLGKHQFIPALERFDAVLREEKDCAAAHWGRALALQGMGRTSLALTALGQVEALVQKPMATLLRLRTELLIDLRRYSLAGEVCRTLLALNPGSLSGQWLRLKLLWAGGFAAIAANEKQPQTVASSPMNPELLTEVISIPAEAS